MKISANFNDFVYKAKLDSSPSYFPKNDTPFIGYLEKKIFFDKNNTSSSFGSESNDELIDDGLSGSSSNTTSKDSEEIGLMMSFIYKQLISEDFSYGDDPSLKYVVEELFVSKGITAEMAFINMSSEKIYISKSNIIEKFFALIVSIDEKLIHRLIKPIILMFASSKDESAAEGALILLEKYGKTKDDLALAETIRDFDYGYLNDYKDNVIKYLIEKSK